MEKNLAFLVSVVVALGLLLGILSFFNLLFIPLASMALGMLFVGLALPELMGSMKYSHTVWIPILFTIAGIMGLYFVFGQNAFAIITSLEACTQKPCFPYGFFFLAFFLGSAANWAGHLLSGMEIDLVEGK